MCKLFLAIFLMAFAPLMARDCEEPPLRAFTNVVNSFKDNAILAGRKTVVDTWTTKTGCMFVTFTTNVTCDDDLQKICNAMYRYINKNNWMENVTPKCTAKCDKLTLILEGKDDPNYDPSIEPPKRPLEALGGILKEGFAKGAQLGDYVADCNVYEKHGRWNIEITITVTDPSLTCESVCDNVYAYLDKPGILDGSTKTCQFIDGCPDKIMLHLIG